MASVSQSTFINQKIRNPNFDFPVKEEEIVLFFCPHMASTEAFFNFCEVRYDSLPMGVVVANLQGNILYGNPRIRHLLAYSQEELCQKKVHEISSKEDLGLTEAVFKEGMISQKLEKQIEKRYIGKGGRDFIALSEVQKIEIVGELYFIAFITDISGKYYSRKQQEQYFQKMVESADDVIYSVDVSGNFTYVNEKACEVVGYSREELLQMNYTEVLAEEFLAETVENYRQLFKSRGDANDFIAVVKRKDGNLYWLHQKLKTIWSRDRRLILGYHALSRDVTEQRKLEERLQESKAHYADLFEHSPFALRLEDFSAVKTLIESVPCQSTSEFRKYLEEDTSFVQQCIDVVKVLEINREVLYLYEASTFEELQQGIAQSFTPETLRNFREELVSIYKGKQEFQISTEIKTLKGKIKKLELKWQVVPGCEETLEKVYVSSADVTELNEAKQAAEENEQYYKGLFENTPIPLWIEDFSAVVGEVKVLGERHGEKLKAYLMDRPEILGSMAASVKVLEVNAKVLALHRAESKEQLLGELQKTFIPESLIPFGNELVKIAEGAVRGEFKSISKTLDGDKVYLLVNWSVMPGHEDNWEKVLVSTIDVSDQEQMLRALKENEERLNTIVQNIRQPIIISDPMDARIVDVNREVLDLLGRDREELIGQCLDLVDGQHNLTYIQQSIQRSLKEDLVIGETLWKKANGETLNISLKNTLINLKGKDLVLTSAADVSQLKRLNELNERFKAALDEAPFAIYITDLDQEKLVDVNEQSCKMLGYSRSELLSMNIQDIEQQDIIRDEEQRKNHFNAVKSSAGSVIEAFGTHRRKDGTTFPVRAMVTSKKIGGVNYLIAAVNDISDEEEKNQKIIQQNEILKIIYNLQNKFISGSDVKAQFEGFLRSLVLFSESEFGFIGEILHDDGVPYLKTHAITDISWDGESKKLYDQMFKSGFEFRNLNTLFGETIRTGQLVIANNPQTDARSGGTPKGHPPLKSYVGIPIEGDRGIEKEAMRNPS